MIQLERALFYESRALELVQYLVQLTHEVNIFVSADGMIVRESDAVRTRRRPCVKGVKKITKSAVRARSKETHSANGWQSLYRAKPRDGVRDSVKNTLRRLQC